ncbi:armadillo-type protein [Fennellomyces sp. T-0311]|nr:armadillo-type protein [Fennellomyces sp. T-0311]
MLIEGIDNANNIENMKLWPAILSQLDTDEPVIRKGVAWVCGTAVQNNPKAQEAFLSHGGLEKLVEVLKKEQNKKVKATIIYAVSGLLKHSSKAQEAFEKNGGFNVLFDIVKRSDEDPATLRKTVFLFNSLLIENKQFGTSLLEQGGLDALDAVLVKYTEQEQDEDMVEKALRTIHTLITETKTAVPAELKKHAQKAADTFGKENLGLADSEWQQLLA